MESISCFVLIKDDKTYRVAVFLSSLLVTLFSFLWSHVIDVENYRLSGWCDVECFRWRRTHSMEKYFIDDNVKNGFTLCSFGLKLDDVTKRNHEEFFSSSAGDTNYRKFIYRGFQTYMFFE
jgi:hypothetical protein